MSSNILHLSLHEVPVLIPPLPFFLSSLFHDGSFIKFISAWSFYCFYWFWCLNAMFLKPGFQFWPFVSVSWLLAWLTQVVSHYHVYLLYLRSQKNQLFFYRTKPLMYRESSEYPGGTHKHYWSWSGDRRADRSPGCSTVKAIFLSHHYRQSQNTGKCKTMSLQLFCHTCRLESQGGFWKQPQSSF